MDHSLDRTLERLARCNGAVSLDSESEAVEICAVTDTHVLNFVIRAADRGKDSIKCDGADIYALLLVQFLCDEAEAAFCTQFHFEIYFATDLTDVLFRV